MFTCYLETTAHFFGILQEVETRKVHFWHSLGYPELRMASWSGFPILGKSDSRNELFYVRNRTVSWHAYRVLHNSLATFPTLLQDPTTKKMRYGVKWRGSKLSIYPWIWARKRREHWWVFIEAAISICRPLFGCEKNNVWTCSHAIFVLRPDALAPDSPVPEKIRNIGGHWI